MRFIATVIEKLQRHPKRLVFPEGTEPRILQAARQFYSLKLGAPILLGDRAKIKKLAEELSISLEGVRILDPEFSEEREGFAQRYELIRRSKGIQLEEAREAMKNPNYFGAMMVAMHQADGVISGASGLASSRSLTAAPSSVARTVMSSSWPSMTMCLIFMACLRGGGYSASFRKASTCSRSIPLRCRIKVPFV